jgi:hypothetical protein
VSNCEDRTKNDVGLMMVETVSVIDDGRMMWRRRRDENVENDVSLFCSRVVPRVPFCDSFVISDSRLITG